MRGPWLLVAAGTIAAGLACASPPPGASWRAAHPDAPRRAPEAGDEIGAVLASLSRTEPAVQVTSLRWLEAGDAPWSRLGDQWWELASGSDAGVHALIVERRCRVAGWRREQVARASWLLFTNRRLSAYEHWEFEPDCTPRHRFLPAPEALREREEELVRELARRFPASALGPAETFGKGLGYLEAGRVEEAEAMLALGERALAAATRAAEDEDAPPGAEAALGHARARRGELRRALRSVRGTNRDPSEQFWKGN